MLDVWSVSRLAHTLQDLIRSDPSLEDLWVEGEVSNLRQGTRGHLYFTLKDLQAQVRCVMFGGIWQAQDLENGHHVLAHGRIDYYPTRGDLQFYVDFVRSAGVGIFRAQFERVLAKLEGEGLFDESRKRPLPPFPKKIGVATSPVGAVFQDICNVIGRRWPLAEVVLASTPVQGPEAVPGLIWAIHRLNEEGVDLIIIARGGGSWEELTAFNDESVARAVFSSRVPVIAGVGHQPDLTIVDLVADRRAPTPSAAAELAVPDISVIKGQLRSYGLRLEAAAQSYLTTYRKELRGCVARLDAYTPKIDHLKGRLTGLAHRIGLAAQREIKALAREVEAISARLKALDPKAVLRRGYALVYLRRGPVVTSVSQVEPGAQIEVQLADGLFPAQVLGQYGF